MKGYLYRIRLQPEPEGGFTVTVPALPGCITWGQDYADALEMAEECIQGFLEALRKADQPVPEDPLTVPVETVVQVKLRAVV
jgi:predicted RNase H-like HicB family nuclease